MASEPYNADAPPVMSIHAFDQRHRDHVEVDRPVGTSVGTRRCPSSSIESALRTEAAQVGVGLAALKAGRALHVADLGQALGGGELRHLTESGVQRYLPRGGDLLRAHCDQRTVRRIARVRGCGSPVTTTSSSTGLAPDVRGLRGP